MYNDRYYNMNLVYGSCKPNGLKTTLNGVCLIIIIIIIIVKSKHSESFLWWWVYG